jgi:hypothetical protein
MARLRDEDYRKFKEISDKEGIKYKTEAEQHDSADNLVNFISLLIKMDQEEKARIKRLEQEPKGFTLESKGRNCPLCHNCIQGEMWYDKWGMKCLNCQEALNKKIVPGYVFKDYKNEKHITDSELGRVSGLHTQTIRKLVRQGKIKARILTKGPMVILKRENPNIGAILNEEKKLKPA